MAEYSLVRGSTLAARLGRRVILLLTIVLLSFMMTTTNAWAQGYGPEWSPSIDFSNVTDMFSSNPVLLCDQNQNTHMFWVESTDQQGLIYYSSDASGKWTEPIDILTAPSVNLMDAAITPDLRVHLVWATVHGGELMYTSAWLPEARDPRAWAIPFSIATDVNVSSNVYGGGNTLYADSTGVLHLLYSRPDDSGNVINSLYYLRSENSGHSWPDANQVVRVAAPEPSSMTGNIAVDKAGRLHVAWEVRSYAYASFSQLGYIRSTDAGKTWNHELDLATGNPPFGVAMAAVFAFEDNEVHLTWDTPDRLHRWSQDGGETWSAPVPIMGLGAAFGGFNKLAKDTAGTLHVVAAVGNGVYHAAWTNGTWGPAVAIDTREFDPHGQQFVICQGNRLHVAYYDRTGENEIWYSSKTVNAPEIARSAITVSEAIPTPVLLEAAALTAPPITSATTPTQSGSLDKTPKSSSPSSEGLFPAIVGAASAALFVIGVMAAKLARRSR